MDILLSLKYKILHSYYEILSRGSQILSFFIFFITQGTQELEMKID